MAEGDIIMSRAVDDVCEVPCCGCPDITEVQVTFSGTEVFPNGCATSITPYIGFKGTSNPILGMFTLTQDAPGVFTWRLTLTAAYTYDTFSDIDCEVPESSGSSDVEIVLTCVNGLLTLNAFAVDIPGFGRLDLFVTFPPFAFDAPGISPFFVGTVIASQP